MLPPKYTKTLIMTAVEYECLLRMLPPKYTKTLTVEAKNGPATVTAKYSGLDGGNGYVFTEKHYLSFLKITKNKAVLHLK